MIADYALENLATDAGEQYRSIISSLMFISLLEDGGDVGIRLNIIVNGDKNSSKHDSRMLLKFWDYIRATIIV